MINKIQMKLRDIIFKIVCWFIPVENNKIVFSSFDGRGYSDNPKYIAEEIIRRKLDYKMYWITKDLNIDLPSQIQPVEYMSFEHYVALASAKVWIDNDRKYIHPIKKKSQFYIMTWHGSLSVKKVEGDALDSLPNSYIRNAKKDSKITDLMLSEGEFVNKKIRRAFFYDGEIFTKGIPKDDIFKSDNLELKNKVYEFYGINKNKKVLLYAPTFRNELDYDYTIDFDKIKERFQNVFSVEVVILVRLHPNLSGTILNNKEIIDVIDVSSYEDIQELEIAAEWLITDYSGVCFDFVRINKPCFLHCPDYNVYLNERGYLLDPKELGIPFSENIDVLLENISKFDYVLYRDKCHQVINDMGLYEIGIAAKNLVNRIIVEMEKK